MSMEKKKTNGGLKEAWRKFLVSLKRRPQMIPLVAISVAFLFYSLNLTDVSNTTARIQGAGMGLSGFAVMLFSMLAFMCCLNAFPYRKKPVVPMVVILYVMLAIMAFADWTYMSGIMAAVNRPENPIVVNQQTIYIAKAYSNLQIHLVLLIVCAALVALLPVYTKLLRKINTSIEVEGNADMGTIELSND